MKGAVALGLAATLAMSVIYGITVKRIDELERELAAAQDPRRGKPGGIGPGAAGGAGGTSAWDEVCQFIAPETAVIRTGNMCPVLVTRQELCRPKN